jgi:hypothetical protein
MNMNNIKQISQDAAVTQVARQQTAPVKNSGESPEQIKNAADSQKDVLQLDQSRKEEAILEQNARLLLNELPEVRPDRVEEARRRLQQGFYDRKEVLQATAGSIQQDVSSAARANTAPADQSETSTVAAARRRLAQGYYDQQDVLDETARRIAQKKL